MNPQTNADLDKSVLNLMNIIGGLETGGESNPYSAVGDKHLVGGSHGKFQYRPDTWKERAGKFLGDPKAPMSQENQNKVTYLTIKDWKDKGLTPQEIDARWNGATIKNGKYVHNAKDREAKFVSAFNSVTNQSKPVAPVSNEPKFGFNQETESQQLARLQSKKADQDALAIQEQQGREGFVDNVLGGAKDFAKGIGNSAERTAGNLITFGNEAIQKAGFKGSENPVLNYGTEANKFATGDATAGTNAMQKVGGFTGDVAPYLAPQLAATKVVGLAKNIPLLQKLAGGGTVTRNLTKAGLLAAEGVMGGAGTNIATEGDAGFGQDLTSLSNPLTQGALTLPFAAATSKLGSMFGKKLGLTEDISSQINKAIEDGDFEKMQKLRETPAMKKYLFSKGLTTDEAILKKADEEVANLRGVLQQHNNPNKAVELNAIDDDGMKTFLRFLSPASKDINGKSSYFKTLQNLNNEESKIVSELGKIKKLISKTDDLAINSVENVEIIRQRALDMAKSRLKGRMATDPITANATEQMINKQIDTLLQRTKGKPSFADVDTLRIAGNKDELGSDLAAQILADAVRTRTDEVVKSLKTEGLSKAEKEAIEYFKNLNRSYGDIQKAKQIVDGFKGVPPETANRLTTLFGATLATGGTYNPFAFVTGAYLSDKIAQAFNRASALSRTPNIGVRMSTVSKTKGDDVMNFLKKESSMSKNKKNTRIGKENKMLELKDPRSLRDILLNTPR